MIVVAKMVIVEPVKNSAIPLTAANLTMVFVDVVIIRMINVPMAIAVVPRATAVPPIHSVPLIRDVKPPTDSVPKQEIPVPKLKLNWALPVKPKVISPV